MVVPWWRVGLGQMEHGKAHREVQEKEGGMQVLTDVLVGL